MIKKLYYIILFLLLYSCKNVSQELEFNWSATSISYTQPRFYLKEIPFKSNIYFVHSLKIKNAGNNLNINISQLNIYEDISGKLYKLYPLYNYGSFELKNNDSLNFEFKSEKKFEIFYDPKIFHDSIYFLSDKILKATKIMRYLNNEKNKASEIFKINDYFVSSARASTK